MIKLVYCLRRLPELSREEFQRYWRETHGPLVRERAGALGIRRYVQLHTLDSPLNEAMRASRGTAPDIYDGVAELWWDSLDAMTAAGGTPEGRAAGRRLLEDERTFVDLAHSPLWLAEEHAVVEPQVDRGRRRMPLQRSRTNKMIAGVCGGIAQWLGWDPTLVRILYIVLSVISVAFPGILVYLVLWVVMPKAPRAPTAA